VPPWADSDGSPADGPIRLPRTRAVCVLLIDGLGWHQLRAAPDLAPFLTALLAAPGSRAITSVFPTTTSIALTSLGTGLAPGEHGVTGLYLRLDGAGPRPVNTLALPAETDMAALQPRATLFERAAERGVAVTRVGPAAFDGAGLTQAALRGGRYLPAESVGERVAAAVEGCCATAPALAYVYVGELDATGHRRGVASAAWRQELRHVDRLAEQLAAALPPGTTLLVTSDHGMVDVGREDRWDVGTTPGLAEGVVAVSGDLRAVTLHVRAGAASDVLAAWRSVVGSGFWVVPGAEAVASGLYGPAVTAEARERIGDVVAVATGPVAITDSRHMPAFLLGLVGLHGAATREELDVPLLVHQV